MADRRTQIHLEVAINGSLFNPLDSLEDSQLRQQLVAQCAEIAAKREIINVPEDVQ